MSIKSREDDSLDDQIKMFGRMLIEKENILFVLESRRRAEHAYTNVQPGEAMVDVAISALEIQIDAIERELRALPGAAERCTMFPTVLEPSNESMQSRSRATRRC